MICRFLRVCRLLFACSFVTQLSAAHRAIIDWNASVIIVSLRRPVPNSDTKSRRFKFCTANLPPDTYAESFIYRVHTFSSTTRFAKLTSVHIPTSTYPTKPIISSAILTTIAVPMMLTSLSSASSVKIFILFPPLKSQKCPFDFLFRHRSSAFAQSPQCKMVYRFQIRRNVCRSFWLLTM